MNIELLRKLGQGLFTPDGGESHLRLEIRTVIPAGSSGHGLSPASGKITDPGQKSHLTTVFRFPEPPLPAPAQSSVRR